MFAIAIVLFALVVVTHRQADSVVALGGLAEPAVRPRAGMTNAGMTNAGMTNAGMTNAGMTNAGMTNAGMTNAGTANAGMTNAGIRSAGTQTRQPDGQRPQAQPLAVPVDMGVPGVNRAIARKRAPGR